MAASPTKKRVLFIGLISPPMSGQSLACDILAEGLRPHYDLDIINLNREHMNSRKGMFRTTWRSLGKIATAFRASRKADLIYFTGGESIASNLKDLLFYTACLGKLDRMIMHLHGGAGMRRLMRGPTGLFRWMNFPFLRSQAVVIVLGERMRDTFRGAVRPERLKIVPNFSEEAYFTTHDQIDAKFERCDPLRLLFLSNPLPGKGHIEIVEAFMRLTPEARGRLRIDFAGRFSDLAEEERFRTLIAPFDELTFLGPVSGETKRKALAEAHVFLLPTYYPYEGQPISILEAFASGCAVVTTDHSGIADTFTDGVNGYQVEKRSPESLQAVFEKLPASFEELRDFARTNLDHARTSFTTDRFLKDMLALFEYVSGTNPGTLAR